MKIVIIGHGAIAAHVGANCPAGADLVAVICRSGRADAARAAMGEVPAVDAVADLPVRPDLVIDCGGHPALIQHGEQVLTAGIELLTVSAGALADAGLHDRLLAAAATGHTRLVVATGAIGALDALAAAAEDPQLEVTYTGRKPPAGWRGSAAESLLDLDRLTTAMTHYRGTARDAALRYPKNANVAAAVALAGAGFERTRVELIADPAVDGNIHEISARGTFGNLGFRIEGRPLPGNPSSSALTAMSVLRAIRQRLTGLWI